MIYCTLLNPVVDVVYTVPELVPGTTMLDVPSVRIPAGKGLNAARSIRTLGEDVTVVGVLPEADAGRFGSHLAEYGIKSEFISVEGSARINVTISELETGQVTHLNSTGPRLSVRIQDELLAFIETKLQPHDIWVLSGSLPRGFEDSTYMKVISMCRDRNITTILDSRGTALNMGIRARPAMVKPNHSELEEYFGESIHGIHHIALKGKRLLDMGVGSIFVSLGEDGMIAVHENDCLLCSPPQVDVVDTVGCGDALVAGVAVAYARQFSFSELCRMAVACGTGNALHTGPGNISPDEVWRLMEDVRIEAV